MLDDHKEVQKKLAEEIKVLYTEQFGSIRKFALEVGCDEKTIRNILNCEQDITLKMFIAISKTLNTSPEKLLKAIIF